MTQPYLIAVDLDGTLLNDEKKIQEKTKQALKAARQQGHKVVISTGRPYRSSVSYYRELGLDTPIVNFNGAFVHHPLDPSWGIYHTPLELKTAKTVFEACEAFAIKNMMAEVLDDVYLQQHDDTIISALTIEPTALKTGRLGDILTDHPTSILVHPEAEHVAALREALQQTHAEVIDQRTWGAPWHVIEIVKAGMNKAVGLKKVAAYFNIPRERVIAFGDEDNDLEMIEYAGHGIAMGNAIETLKSIADDVTETNEDDGIAHYLRQVIGL